MDYKILDADGNVVARTSSAREARSEIQAMPSEYVLLDDTGFRLSAADLDVLCSAETAAGGGEA